MRFLPFKSNDYFEACLKQYAGHLSSKKKLVVQGYIGVYTTHLWYRDYNTPWVESKRVFFVAHFEFVSLVVTTRMSQEVCKRLGSVGYNPNISHYKVGQTSISKHWSQLPTGHPSRGYTRALLCRGWETYGSVPRDFLYTFGGMASSWWLYDFQVLKRLPIGSMYGIFMYMCLHLVDVYGKCRYSKYDINGAYM